VTRPIYEPSLPRTDRQLGFSADQLFRRPAPTSGDGAVPGTEWVRSSSTTNWIAGSTDLQFNSGAGSWDTSYPTFDFVDGHLEIFKPGLYSMNFEILNLDLGSGTETIEANLEIAVVDGPIPDGGAVNGLSTVGSFNWTTRQPYFIPGSEISSGAGVALNWAEHCTNVFAYEEPWYPLDPTPAEFQVNALKYIDGVDGFADSGVVVRMWIIRHGFVWTE